MGAEIFDVAVVGAGPGGSVAAADLAQAGLSVLLLEREGFPRYHTGESLTGIAGKMLRRFGLEEEMKRRQFLVKTGGKVVGTNARSEFFIEALVPTYQVRRAEFDQMLLDRAKSLGVVYRQGSAKDVIREGEKVVGLTYQPAEGGEPREVRCRALIDASGHHAFLSRLGVAGPREVDAFGRQVAVFTEFENAVRDPGEMGNNTFTFYSEPYHWAWFIPVSETSTSVGIIVPVKTFKAQHESPEALLAWGVEHINPDLTRRLKGCRQVEKTRMIRNYSYRIEPFAGDGWLCVGESHRFTDPIFAIGVAMAMMEAEAASRAVQRSLAEGSFTAAVSEYVAWANRGHDAINDLIRYFWKYPTFFGVQARGPLRKDIIKLLAGDCHAVEEMPALAAMRKSLTSLSTEKLGDPRTREIARRVLSRYTIFQGIDEILLEEDTPEVRVSFVLADEDRELRQSLEAFERTLATEFGRGQVRVSRWAPGSSEPRPDAGHAHVRYRREQGRV